MSDQQMQKFQQALQINQQLQQRLGGSNLGLLGSLESRYGAPLSGQTYPNIGTPLPTPTPFNFNIQPQAMQQMNPFTQMQRPMTYYNPIQTGPNSYNSRT